MIPFPIMSTYSNILPASTIVLDIDFNLSAVGSTEIVDGAGHTFSTVGTVGTVGTGSAVVVVDAVKGNVMKFGTGIYFSTPVDSNLAISTKRFELRLVFNCSTRGENILLSTGDFYNSGLIEGGLLLDLFNNTGSQMFCTDSSGLFTRCIFPYTVGTWIDISFIWDPITKLMRVLNNDLGTELSYSVPNTFGDGTLLCIGGSSLRGTGIGTYNGLLQRLRLTTYN